jgi:RNA polymerase sigma-70 factor (ECF subfamily)
LGGVAFPTTHWSVVLATTHADSERAQAALARLYQAYWYPLYSFVRARGYPPHEAQDLAQDFFCSLLKRNSLQSVTKEKGRFRSYLMGAAKHFLANEWNKMRREKRGGAHTFVALDDALAESRFLKEPAHAETPETIYEKTWATVLLERVMTQLRREYEGAKARQFEELKVCLSGEKSAASYAEIGARLEMSEAAVKVAVHRMRARYRELLCKEISDTVAHPAEIEDELKHLLNVLRR